MNVSIIVPMYNVSDTLRRTLESIKNQSYYDIEVILIDDGSQDDTAIVANEFCKKDTRFKYIYKENGGVSSARNKGIKEHSGHYIAFVDSDDYIHPQYVETLLASMTDDIDWVICGYQTGKNCFITKKEMTDRDATVYELADAKVPNGYLGNKLFKSSIIRDNDICFDQSVHMCEDLLFCVEYACKIKHTKHLDKVLYFYEPTNASITRRMRTKKAFTQIDALEKCVYLLTLYSFHPMVVNRYINFLLRITTGHYLKRIATATSSEKNKVIETLKTYKKQGNPGFIIRLKILLSFVILFFTKKGMGDIE
ncbi:glycosyltransferase family 2 protein [Facklamia sp. DSM 111018]|uniref:Glycosyltransferase family 2 protein n=1 Tax=Facklamia lactis TaxID=2749967 RepID=A0ABS0LMJ1_9LACT|nr:glycosyltransferase family 2 protein [Facklamia lactis]MBG9979937.1 glycosyltransferase family 2 protein [Facklamia lactis]MBG9985383.1 glycosyltransferase family 2 protein [Facklamia lactis]